MEETAFSRLALLMGEEALETLGRARVAIFGLGGVGSFATEALARSGIGQLSLCDADVVSLSNINRQLIATRDTIGRPKTAVMAERIRAIHPDCVVETYSLFYGEDTAAAMDLSGFDYIVDAIDTVTAKCLLAQRAKGLGLPFISCMGTGNKLDPTLLRVADLSQTQMCPLARVMRTALRQRGIRHMKVVFSPEPPLSLQKALKAPSGKPIPGSSAFVPPAAGLLLAREVVLDLVGRGTPRAPA